MEEQAEKLPQILDLASLTKVLSRLLSRETNITSDASRCRLDPILGGGSSL